MEKQPAVSGKRSAASLDDMIMNAIPLMAPVPTAWMIGLSTYTIMDFPLPVAIISALTVEGIGFVSINTANEMREFNRHLNGAELKQKMQAPAWQAYGVSGLYVGTATLMTVVFHIVPSLADYAALPFILMAVAGGWLWALRRDHQDRFAKWQEGRSLATLKRRSAKVSDGASDAQRRSATKSAKVYRCECGWQDTNRYKYSGHARQCEVHKAGKLIPVEMPIKENAQS